MKKILIAILAILILASSFAACKPAATDAPQTSPATVGSLSEPAQTSPATNETPSEPASTDETTEEEQPQSILYRYATAEEGRELLMSNTAYYAGFTENDLQYRLKKADATLADMDEYLAFAKEQVIDFTDEQKAKIDGKIGEIVGKLNDNGYILPPIDEIVFVNTTMKEESGAGGYTHGTQIYLNAAQICALNETEQYSWILEYMLVHELFHCLTRCNPDFRAEMYKLIRFTVQEKDFELPPSVLEYYISNPDVEHHDAYATFTIDGQPTDCFLAFVTKEHYAKEGDTFFTTATAALVPVDGSDVYYYPEDTSDFLEVLGGNTGYTVDPEECMADNFAYLIVYGLTGPDGSGFASPEIIEGIAAYLQK